MRVKFDVGLELELEVKEHDYHYDESDQCFPWIRITCEGDLGCGLDDWEIKRIIPYNSQNSIYVPNFFLPKKYWTVNLPCRSGSETPAF